MQNRGTAQRVVSSEDSFYALAELRVSPVMEDGVGNRSRSIRGTNKDTHVQKAGKS